MFPEILAGHIIEKIVMIGNTIGPIFMKAGTHFTDTEIIGMDTDTMDILDMAMRMDMEDIGGGVLED